MGSDGKMCAVGLHRFAGYSYSPFPYSPTARWELALRGSRRLPPHCPGTDKGALMQNRPTPPGRLNFAVRLPARSLQRKPGQGRAAAPAGWCGPQRSEDTGQTGRTLDAVGASTLRAGVWVVQAVGRNCPHPCHVANGSPRQQGEGRGGVGWGGNRVQDATERRRRRFQSVGRGLVAGACRRR